MVFPPSAKSNCALIFSKFNCPIEEDWAIWTLTVDLPVCVFAYVKLYIKLSRSASWYFCYWQHAASLAWTSSNSSSCSFLVSELKLTLSSSLGFCICQAALNLAAGVYLLYVLAGVSLLNEGEQDCHHPEDSTAQPLWGWWITWGCICLRVCAWAEQEYTCVQIIFACTQKKTSFCTITVCSNPLRSYSTGSWVHGQPSQQAREPPVIQVFEFAACEGIQASMWHSGICTFAVSVCQCWALHSPMDQCLCIDPLEQPLVPLTFQVHPRQLLPVAPLLWRWLTSVRFSQARNQSANWCRRVGCCWSVPRSFFG